MNVSTLPGKAWEALTTAVGRAVVAGYEWVGSLPIAAQVAVWGGVGLVLVLLLGIGIGRALRARSADYPVTRPRPYFQDTK